MTCEICDATAALLGILGRLAWFRCIGCGIEFNVDADDIAPDDLAITIDK